MTHDPQLWRWFDDGMIAEALIGDGRFFIRAPAFAVHDRLFVLRQLGTWARSRGDDQVAQTGVATAIDRLAVAARPDDVVDILVCLQVLEDDHDAFGADPALARSWLEQAERMYVEAGILTSNRSDSVGRLRLWLDRRS